MADARPWMMFYPQDWRADESLRLCSLAARGLWLEMLALMHRSERYGYLLVKGKAPDARQLAMLVGGAVDEVDSLVAELEEYEVFNRDRNGTIYSRRMIRDEKRSKTAAKNGAKGGNPKLRKQRENSASDIQTDKPAVGASDKPHIPESRTPPIVPPKSGKRQLPGDWEPEAFGDGTEAAVIVAGWRDAERIHQLDQFRDHHRAKGSKFSDWNAAWGTWVRNSVRFARQSPASEGGGSGFVDRVLAEKGLKVGVP